MKINRFEEINAWQEARKLVKMVYSAVAKNKELQFDLRFKSQFTSSSVSVMSNIAEGFSRNSNKEFVRFLFISKGSLAEVQSLLYVALDLNYIKNDLYNNMYTQADVTARYISKFISYLKITYKNNPTQKTQQTQ